MTKTFEVSVPLNVVLPRKTKADKNYILNMNNYRNWMGIVSNNIKKQHFEDIKHLFEGVKFDKPVDVVWRLYKKTKARSDKSNVYAVQSKFVFDVMTQCDCWPDDNDDFIKSETQLPTRHDKENPRCVFIFTEIDEEDILQEEGSDYC